MFVLRFIAKIFLYIFRHIITILGTVTAVLLLTGLVGFLATDKSPIPMPENALLVVDLSGGVTESTGQDIFTSYFSGSASNGLISTISMLDAAAKEPRIKGLLVNLSTEDLNMSQAQELRDAVTRFKAKGKTTAVFSDSFGEMGGGNVAYYLASAFDHVWLQPSGQLSLVGFSAEMPFFKGTFDKLGIVPRFAKRKDFKTAPESFTETQMSAAHKQSMQYLIDGLSDQLLTDVALARQTEKDRLKSLINQAPFSAKAAKDIGLVDNIGYWDQAKEETLKALGPKAKAFDFYDFQPTPHKHLKQAKHVAIVPLNGEIFRGFSDTGDFTSITSIDTGQILEDLINDESVDGIILRVDSPGGSYVASDTLWNIIKKAHDKKKPVVASVASVAASGGYFLVMGADKIVLPPSAITGSIGVFSGKFIGKDFAEKIGVTFDGVESGENANLFSPTKDFTENQWQKFNQVLDEIYDDFTTKVSVSRKLDKAKVEELAQGKIWLGSDAVNNGLADKVGGIYESVDTMKQLLGLKPSDEIVTFFYPPPRTLLEHLADLVSQSPRILSRDGWKGLTKALSLLGQIDTQPQILSAPSSLDVIQKMN